MLKIISKLLVSSGYVKENPTDPNLEDIYVNNEIKDCMILCEYDIKELANFDNSKKTKSLMESFSKAKKHDEVLKNTSAIITLKLDKFSDYEAVKNIVLDVEENPYGFRKYICTYTSEGIKKISENKKINDYIVEIVFSPERFNKFEDGDADEEFRTCIELFIKLPFLSIRSIPAIEISEFNNPMENSESKYLKHIYESTNPILDDDNLTTEEQIDGLLNDELVKKFFIKKNVNEK